MTLTIRESLRRKRPQFTDAERATLVDELLAERWSPPEPTLTECHEMWREARVEADRFESMEADAVAEVARLEERMAERIKARPAMARQIARDFAGPIADSRSRVEAAREARAELDRHVDWDVLQAGEKRFQEAVRAAVKAHNAARLVNAREHAEKARAKLDEARSGIAGEFNHERLEQAVRKAGEAEVASIWADRALAEVERQVKGK